MTDILLIGIKCLAAILAGIFAGNGAVYFFNKMPAAWLCDYGEKPSEELLDPYTQRVKSYPWKFIFTMLFVVLGIKMVMDDWQFAIAGICALWPVSYTHLGSLISPGLAVFLEMQEGYLLKCVVNQGE